MMMMKLMMIGSSRKLTVTIGNRNAVEQSRGRVRKRERERERGSTTNCCDKCLKTTAATTSKCGKLNEYSVKCLKFNISRRGNIICQESVVILYHCSTVKSFPTVCIFFKLA